MRVFKYDGAALVHHDSRWFRVPLTDWDLWFAQDSLYEYTLGMLSDAEEITRQPDILDGPIGAPIGTQEVWACGVTYLRSRAARMEESQDTAGGDFYDKVYDAVRPELFFKSTASRVRGHREAVRIRQDSSWDVPEPELTLAVSASGHINGYTIGNDMSSRSIEGENPLYLPQAKTYEGSAALGPCLYLSSDPIAVSTGISMHIHRNDKVVFSGETSLDQMKRSHQELVDFLTREMVFPQGVYLMTGTGIVPDAEFTLQAGDRIAIHLPPVGTLVNLVDDQSA